MTLKVKLYRLYVYSALCLNSPFKTTKEALINTAMWECGSKCVLKLPAGRENWHVRSRRITGTTKTTRIQYPKPCLQMEQHKQWNPGTFCVLWAIEEVHWIKSDRNPTSVQRRTHTPTWSHLAGNSWRWRRFNWSVLATQMDVHAMIAGCGLDCISLI